VPIKRDPGLPGEDIQRLIAVYTHTSFTQNVDRTVVDVLDFVVAQKIQADFRHSISPNNRLPIISLPLTF
jgi:hypothetical protein